MENMSRKYHFEVVFEKEKEGGFHAYCPDLPGCHTYGKTLKQAKRHIQEAVEAYCESLKKSGESIPQSKTRRVLTSEIRVALKAA